MCRAAINVAAAASQSAKSNASGKHHAEQLVHRQTEITAMFSKETSARLDARTNQTIDKVRINELVCAAQGGNAARWNYE